MHKPHPSHPKYRPDIDGMRAIAVLAVVIFHAFPKSMKGGFIGVDVFFVISGYLISTIIFTSLEKGSFSFTDFYTRRIKRIFPALLLVLAACLAFGWFALLAEEYRQLGKHIAAGAGFVSNFVFWNEVGYFDNSADTKPLLHLWSLGIEEQFYIFWPILLWFSWKHRLNLFVVTAIAAALSFFLNLYGVGQDPTGTFYSPQTRFWELLSGSLLAWATLYKKEAAIKVKNKLISLFYKQSLESGDKAFANLLSFGGIALLIIGFFKVSEKLQFPGVWALIPVLAAVFIIAAGPKAWVNRKILSSKVAVWFGLISFPLYLWHWPLLSFARIINDGEPHRDTRNIIIITSILLAWLTYKAIEQPLRFGKQSTAKVFILVSLMALLGGFGFTIYKNDGLSFRENAKLANEYSGDIGHLEYHRFIANKYFVCTPKNIADAAGNWEGFIRCNQSKPSSDIDIALVGDSHAEHLFLGMAEALPDRNIVFYAKGELPSVHNPEFKDIFDVIISSKSISQVILSAYWVERYKAIPVDSTLEEELVSIIDLLSKSGKSVHIAMDIPTFPFRPILCKGSRWPKSIRGKKCDISVEDLGKQDLIYSAAFKRVAEMRPSTKILNPSKYLCNDKICSMALNSSVLYRDENHLNLIGSSYVGRRLVEDNPGIFSTPK